MKRVFLNGEFLDKKEAKISPFDHGFLFGDGVYETLLALEGKVMDFTAHFERLCHSCETLGITFPHYLFPNPQQKLFSIVKTLIAQNHVRNGRIRITISRGENNFDFTSSPHPTVLISVSPLPTYPDEFFEKGVSIKTIPFERSYPEVKSINFLASLMGRREISQTGEYEGVFVTSEGFFREGTVSNICVFGKKKSDLAPEYFFWKAPEKTVLSGTMQEKLGHVLVSIVQDSLEVSEKNFSLSTLFSLQKEKNCEFEVYITNSLFGVLPVSTIDGYSVLPSNKKFSLFEDFIGKGFREAVFSFSSK